MKRSIRIRLLVWIMALVVPLSAAAGWLLVEVFAARLLRDIDVALEEEAETVAVLLEKPAGAEAMSTILAHIAAETDLGIGKQVVVTRHGQVVGEAPGGARAILAARDDPSLRVATYTAGSSADAITVTIGVLATAALHARQRLTVLLGLGIPGALLVMSAGLWGVAGRALRPLEDAAGQLEAMTGANLSARVPVTTSDDEVGRMVGVLNRMLGRLEDSVEELQRFTADAAHELRTPLTILRTGLEVALARERSAPEYQTALREALVGTDRLCRLAEDLLTLTRVDAGGESEGRTRVELAEMLQELVDAWMPVCGQRSIDVAVEVPADTSVTRVTGSAGDLYRLFNNLIDNAVGHSQPRGRVRVAVEVVAPWVHVTVADEGPGIGVEEAGRVFDRFYRGNSTRAKGVGSGLGLSIAKKIAAAHGGQITVGNGRIGCVARVTLPLS